MIISGFKQILIIIIGILIIITAFAITGVI